MERELQAAKHEIEALASRSRIEQNRARELETELDRVEGSYLTLQSKRLRRRHFSKILSWD
eukprot:5785691-Amphidinium_carterae.1